MKLFRPSAAPPLEVCVHWKNLERDMEEKEVGDNYHKDFAAIFNNKLMLSEIVKSRREKATWAIGVQKQYMPWVTGVERHIELYGEADQFLTDGTIDLDGECDLAGERIPSIIDWKAGDYIDRSAQLTTYALARMDESNAAMCRITAAYYNDGEVDSKVIFYADAKERVTTLIERLQGKRGPDLYNISVWCSFCAVRMSEQGCPAWNEQRLTLAQTHGLPAELSASLLALKTDPERRAKFIIAKRRFDALVKAYELEEDALKDVLDGKEVA